MLSRVDAALSGLSAQTPFMIDGHRWFEFGEWVVGMQRLSTALSLDAFLGEYNGKEL